jgi:replication factor C subunit 3/5
VTGPHCRCLFVSLSHARSRVTWRSALAHRPPNLDKLTLHESLNARLSKVANSSQFLHMLFHGPPGSGKRTRTMCVLREMFGGSVEEQHEKLKVEKLKVEHREFKLDGVSKPVKLTMVCSNHHVELNPSDAGTKDSKIVQEVIEGIAENHAISSAQHSFKVVVLNEVDRLLTSA